MPEILTESFCERCGTRYTFELAAPKGARLKGIKVLSRGLKNFVLSDDSSIDEAMAAARSETDRELTSFQLDAFHKTFNFCMTCRQYTCGNCWNEAEGSCLSCAPHLGHEILPAPFPDLDRNGGFLSVNGANGSNGANGTNGFSGTNGANGANGHAAVDDFEPDGLAHLGPDARSGGRGRGAGTTRWTRSSKTAPGSSPSTWRRAWHRSAASRP